LKSSLPIERVRERIRAVSAPLEGDRVLHHDISALEKLLAGGGFRQ
jgi:histidine ammonia-lyase